LNRRKKSLGIVPQRLDRSGASTFVRDELIKKRRTKRNDGDLCARKDAVQKDQGKDDEDFGENGFLPVVRANDDGVPDSSEGCLPIRGDVDCAPAVTRTCRSASGKRGRRGRRVRHNEQTLLVQDKPEQHSPELVHAAPMDLQVDCKHVGNSPPPHRPEQHSPLLPQKSPLAVHFGPPASGPPASSGTPPSGGGEPNVPHFSLPPSLGSGEQTPPQQSSGVWHASPSGLHLQSPHVPLLQMLLQQSALFPHESPMTLQANPLSHVLLFWLHFLEQHSSSVMQADPVNAQHGPWQRVTPKDPSRQSSLPCGTPGQHSPNDGSHNSPGGRQFGGCPHFLTPLPSATQLFVQH